MTNTAVPSISPQTASLVKRLRRRSHYIMSRILAASGNAVFTLESDAKDMDEAASTITRLEQERDDEYGKRMNLGRQHIKQTQRLYETQARLSQVEQERDSAIAHDRQPYPTAWRTGMSEVQAVLTFGGLVVLMSVLLFGIAVVGSAWSRYRRRSAYLNWLDALNKEETKP